MKGTPTIVTALLLLTPLPALAANETTESVTVIPPYVVAKASTGYFKDKETTVTISRNVDYGDLDLKTPQGQAALQGRVKEAAAGVCHQLDRRYPTSMNVPVKSGNCVRTAENDAMAQVRGGGAQMAMAGSGNIRTAAR